MMSFKTNFQSFKNFFLNRMSDMCEYCEKGILLKKKITEFIKNEGYTIKTNTFDVRDLIKEFNQKAVQLLQQKSQIQVNETNNSCNEPLVSNVQDNYEKYRSAHYDLQDYEAILFHKNVAKCQRLAYNNHRKNLEELRGKLLIELDFKEKIKIGMSPRQVSREFYEQISVSCLGKIRKFKILPLKQFSKPVVII